MELLNETYCPYCESYIDVESMLTIENLKEMHLYLTCSECKKTFIAHTKTKVAVDVSNIEDKIKEVKYSLRFWKKSKMDDKEFKNYLIKVREKLIQELEAIKERNDSKE